MNAPSTAQPRLLAGASGYAYDEWKGAFYPDKLRTDEMLGWYARHLRTVEINNTFYRMPRRSVLEQWAAVVPEGFSFAIKASRRITHEARLKAEDAAEAVGYLYRNLEVLGGRRGPVLFQLPPFLKRDVPRLASFIALLPTGHRAAFEFRDESWLSDEVFETLRAADAALCLTEREDHGAPRWVATASWGYVRLRLEQYGEAELAEWAVRIAAAPWGDAHVYFMHEPTAPRYAAALARLYEASLPTG
ncbi:MAG: DUF72 domain-containing protein [Rubrivivax sp.]|nr:DUF72 domain-containing protein [Rubrivivax sp.]